METGLVTTVDVHELSRRLEGVIIGMDVTPETRRKYSARVPHLTTFIADQIATGIPPHDWLANYKRVLLAQHSATTAAAYFAAARAIVKRLHTLGVMPTDITSGVKGIQTARGHKRAGVNAKEVERLKGVLVQADTRTRAICALLLLQGLRQIEVSRLDVSDFDAANNTLLVQGKGCDDKVIVHLNPATTAALTAYLESAGHTDGALFRSVDRASKGARLTTRSIRRLVKSVFAVADVNKCVHGLRHYFVTTLLDALQGDIIRVQQWTRHKTLDMLVVYNDECNALRTAPVIFAALGALTI